MANILDFEIIDDKSETASTETKANSREVEGKTEFGGKLSVRIGKEENLP